MRFITLVIALLTTSCSTLNDCGGAGGVKVFKIRSSTTRMVLADVSAASARFAPFAAMSALVYEESAGCSSPRSLGKRPELEDLLSRAGWQPYTADLGLPGCDDELGMFVRVWRKETTSSVEYTLVFRGTGRGLQDWFNGNLWWLRRLLPGTDQYASARSFAEKLVWQVKKNGSTNPLKKKVIFYSSGHSLGGGLAQSVLYAFPEDFLQAYAFDPSPVTAYSTVDNETRSKACSCEVGVLDYEARVYRIYDTQEILSWLRYPLKIVLPPNRHIQEVRFNFAVGHSIEDLASSLGQKAGSRPLGVRNDWWLGLGKGPNGLQCSAVFRKNLVGSCAATCGVCPR